MIIFLTFGSVTLIGDFLYGEAVDELIAFTSYTKHGVWYLVAEKESA
jgi:hypothetical protein